MLHSNLLECRNLEQHPTASHARLLLCVCVLDECEFVFVLFLVIYIRGFYF